MHVETIYIYVAYAECSLNVALFHPHMAPL